MTRAKLVQLTAIALVVWTLTCIAIYWMFVSLLGVPSMTAVLVAGATVLVTAPFVGVATARNFRRIGDEGFVSTGKPVNTMPILFLVFGFGVSAILVLASIAALERGSSLGGAVMAALAALFASISTWRLRTLGRMR